MVSLIPLFGPIPGGPELLIILLVLVLLFGANKIPKLARSTGQAMGEFKKGREEVEEELRQMTEGEKEAEREASSATATETTASTAAEEEPEETPAETAETAEATEKTD